MHITLTLNRDDTNILVKALDLYSRLGIGQIEEVKELFRDTMPIENMDDAMKFLQEAKFLMTGIRGNGSHGIGNPAVGSRYQRAYEIRGALQYAVATNDPSTPSYSVWKQLPLALTGHPFPKVEVK